ncbi:multicopper oxidase family protein [Methylocapsa polymorpha]|uniref:Multicopper oxidase family protein n=1 Tax=Methylocapsa polymorpha TaxID=3080828 RepID=A0ABZ0HU24_9HYPH|nr:multicopper oxidase family protein [Methylocapsa sp. RX1]
MFWRGVETLLVFIGSSAHCSAQTANLIFANPPRLEESTSAPPRETELIAPQAALGLTGKRQLDLNIVYTDNKIWNPASNRFDKVRLRSYAGADANPEAPYVAPLIEVKPGERVGITLHNKLPADPSCLGHDANPDAPHCFNGTNLHAHGLWVSPTGNSDNVLLSINPGVDFEYEYNIPADHPSGTFWYHSHRHGSTALQVSSGMAGALIVRGERPPTPKTNGDIDVILKNQDLSALEERILVLQQIQYACLDAKGDIKVQKDSSGNVVAWVCNPGDVGGIEFYSDPSGQGQFGPGTWNQSGRYTTINGLVRPVFQARAGRVERWRLIHAGVRDTITLAFRRKKPGAPSAAALRPAELESYISEYCTGDPLAYHQIAADGLTMAKAHPGTLTTLQPGYRYDALVVFPESGDYCVTNESAPAAGSVSRQAVSRQLLGTVEVAPGATVSNIGSYLTEALISVAERTLAQPVRGKVVADLKDGLKLTSFVPHPDIEDGELTGKQELVFFIDVPQNGNVKFEVGNKSIDPKNFDSNAFKPLPYDPNRVDRTLRLGGVDEWTLQSGFVSHPFHIHVNPFQIVEIIDPNGHDVSAPGAVDNGGGQIDPQYPGLKGVWKDTLWVKNLISNPADFPAKLPSSVYTIKVRTRYQRYIGEYVLHCHILDHEDQGMMQNVEIVLPDGIGGLVSSLH